MWNRCGSDDKTIYRQQVVWWCSEWRQYVGASQRQESVLRCRNASFSDLPREEEAPQLPRQAGGVQTALLPKMWTKPSLRWWISQVQHLEVSAASEEVSCVDILVSVVIYAWYIVWYIVMHTAVSLWTKSSPPSYLKNQASILVLCSFSSLEWLGRITVWFIYLFYTQSHGLLHCYMFTIKFISLTSNLKVHPKMLI